MKSLANPLTLKPVLKKEQLIQVVIECPAQCRNKFAFDPDQSAFVLKKVLPAGMSFPYDFGFIPQTTAPDGDPVDVILLMDEPAYPGCVVPARVIGVIEGSQLDGKKPVRNDRVVAVAQANQRYANVLTLEDLPHDWVDQVGIFFVNYHQLEGKRYELLGHKGADTAFALIEKSRQ